MDLGTLVTVSDNGQEVSKPYPTIRTPTWKGIYEDMALAIRGERDVPCSAEDARNGMRVYGAAMRSIEEGRRVEM